jgi:hypothetical protein
MGLDFRVLEKIAFSLVVAFAVILLAFMVHGKWPGLTRQIDDVVVSMSSIPTMCLPFEEVDCPRRLSGMCCA